MFAYVIISVWQRLAACPKKFTLLYFSSRRDCSIMLIIIKSSTVFDEQIVAQTVLGIATPTTLLGYRPTSPQRHMITPTAFSFAHC